MHTNVLIVGAGPTGLMLANQLARRGIKPLIIDRHSGPAQQSRAMAVHARTLEIYSKMGLADQALALGARGTAGNMWANRHLTARVPVGDIGRGLSPYPFVLMLGQDDNEHILGARLNEMGVIVQWNTELVSLQQHESHVEVILKRPDGSHKTLAANWVAGCDGSRSKVREACGIGFPGAPYEHTFFVADTVATGSMRPSELNVYFDRGGFHLFFPMRGQDRWRVIGILPPELRQKDGVTFEDVIPTIRDVAGVDLHFQSCAWFSTYKIHHRAAERFRQGRCFLLGDAAHVHSPMGAQGMNTGLQDAYNLAWKLAFVTAGRANPALLDTYEAERLPVARALLRTTDRNFQIVVDNHWIARLLRTHVIGRVVARAMTFEGVRQRAFKALSQIGIAYHKSPLSKALGTLPRSAPKPGERFPWMKLRMKANGPVEDLFQALDDRQFNLLLIGQPEALAYTPIDMCALVRPHAIPIDAGNAAEFERLKVPSPSYFLLRPDGHIAASGGRFDALAVERFLAPWLEAEDEGIIRLDRRKAA
ncbi:MAG: FAD-dependent monooxygenase [Alphaproteobacteria bacterium]|nr:FAD-dependent monooxygenase [Alphaproteobacteria bacterium]